MVVTNYSTIAQPHPTLANFLLDYGTLLRYIDTSRNTLYKCWTGCIKSSAIKKFWCSIPYICLSLVFNSFTIHLGQNVYNLKLLYQFLTNVWFTMSPMTILVTKTFWFKREVEDLRSINWSKPIFWYTYESIVVLPREYFYSPLLVDVGPSAAKIINSLLSPCLSDTLCTHTYLRSPILYKEHS